MSSDDPRNSLKVGRDDRQSSASGAAAPPLTGQRGGESSVEEWDAICASADFKELLAAKARFTVPVTIFFIAYYFALPISVGFFPKLMDIKIGKANVAYLFALSQFFVAWAIAFAYTRIAARWDEMARRLLERFPPRKRAGTS